MKASKKLAALLSVALLTLTGTAQALLISPTDFTNLAGWKGEVTTAVLVDNDGTGTILPTVDFYTIPNGGTLTLNLATLFPGIDILGYSFSMSGLSTSGGRTTTVATVSSPASGASWSAFTATTGYVGVLSESNEFFTSISFTKSASGSDSFTISDFHYATAAPVPVPAAVWLMGSALLGLVGIGRKKKTA